MAEDWFDVVDEKDCILRQERRSEVHRLNLLHRAVQIFIPSPGRGGLWLQLRSATKDQFPNLWTSSASGHVDAGEDYETAARREMKEELGIDGLLIPLQKFKASPVLSYEHTFLYECVSDGPFQPDPGEVARVEWFADQEIREWIRRAPDDLTPCFRFLWDWYDQRRVVADKDVNVVRKDV